MPENIEGASPRARLARMTKLLGMQPSADAPSVIQRLVDVLEVLSLENTDQGRQVLEEAGKLLLTTTEDRREEAKVQAMSEYRTSPGTMICAASTYVNQAMKDRHLPPLSDDEREQVDLIVPERR